MLRAVRRERVRARDEIVQRGSLFPLCDTSFAEAVALRRARVRMAEGRP